MRKHIFLIIVALGIMSVQYHRIKDSVMRPQVKDATAIKIMTFMSIGDGLDNFRAKISYFWNGRIVSCYVGNMFCKIIDVKTVADFGTALALHGILWLSLSLIVIILLSKKKYVFLFGFGIGLQSAWLPIAESQYTPWDMPVLFFWTLILLLNETKHKRHILWIIPVGAFFKETTVVLSILILFWDDTDKKERLRLFLITSILGVAVKVICSVMGGSSRPLGNQSYHYDKPCRTGEYWIIHRNLNFFFQWKDFNHELLSVCGLWVGTFILPIHKKFKWISAIYLGSIFFPCVWTESRLWQELLPVFLVGFDRMKNEAFT